MKVSNRIDASDCGDARRLVHEQLDGSLEEGAFRDLTRHLVRCPRCRRHQRELRGAMAKVRELPMLKLDDGALERVWDRTILAPRPATSLRARASAWTLPAAAAALLLAAFGSFALWEHARTVSEERRAEAELRLAVNVAGKALRRGREATVEAVRRSDLVPALDRIPVLNLIATKISERRT